MGQMDNLNGMMDGSNITKELNSKRGLFVMQKFEWEEPS